MRFRTVFSGCRSDRRIGAGPTVHVRVDPLGDGYGEAVFDLRGGDVPVDVPALCAAQAFPRDEADEASFRPDGWARPLSAEADRIVFHLDDPWHWLVGHLSVYAVLIPQTHLLCFHGAAMRVFGSGMMLLGSSGAGKTTLAVEMAQRGHGYLSDEIAAVEVATRRLVPIRRSALVREGDDDRRTALPGLSSADDGEEAGLRYVVCLRGFTDESNLEAFCPTVADLNYITPLSCSLGDGARSVMRVLGLIGDSDCYFLDSADPASAVDLLETLATTS